MAPNPNGELVQVVSGANDLEVKVALNGYNAFKKALKDADKELRRDMDREIRAILKPVATHAQALVPTTVMRNWRVPRNARTRRDNTQSPWATGRAWDQARVKRGIAVRQGGRRQVGSQYSSAWSIQNRTAAGAIYETAGKKSSGHGVAGENFVSAIMAAGGRPSRLIYRAWDAMGGEKKMTVEVIGVIKKYEKILQSRADSGGKD